MRGIAILATVLFVVTPRCHGQDCLPASLLVTVDQSCTVTLDGMYAQEVVGSHEFVWENLPKAFDVSVKGTSPDGKSDQKVVTVIPGEMRVPCSLNLVGLPPPSAPARSVIHVPPPVVNMPCCYWWHDPLAWVLITLLWSCLLCVFVSWWLWKRWHYNLEMERLYWFRKQICQQHPELVSSGVGGVGEIHAH